MNENEVTINEFIASMVARATTSWVHRVTHLAVLCTKGAFIARQSRSLDTGNPIAICKNKWGSTAYWWGHEREIFIV